MGFSPQAGQVGIRTQSAKGSYADPGAADPNYGIFFKTKSGSFGTKRDLLVTDPEIGGNRDVSDAYLGPAIFVGEFEFYCRLEAIATLLYGALGAKSSATSGAGATLVGTHTLTPADTIPWLSVEEAVANGFEVFQYTDAVVNTLHLEVEANGYVQGSVGLIALSQTSGNTKTASPHWDPSNLIVGTNVNVVYNSVTLPAKKWTLDINNNIEDNDFRLGSLFATDLTPKRREVMMSCTVRPTDATLWKRAAYGSSAATSVQGGTAAKAAIAVDALSYENINSSSTKYEISLDAPSAAIKPFDNKVNGDDVLEQDFEIQLFRPTTADLATFTVKNGIATVR